MSLLRRFLCRLRGHSYLPVCEEEKITWGRRTARHTRFQYRWTCNVCGRRTPWVRRKDRQAWEEAHRVSW